MWDSARRKWLYALLSRLLQTISRWLCSYRTTVFGLSAFSDVPQTTGRNALQGGLSEPGTNIKDTSRILKELADGQINILIGTHKIIGKSVKFKDLGLLIIDEEQEISASV